MDLVKSMASAAQGHQTWMLAWRCGSKLLREYAASMRKEHQIEVRGSQQHGESNEFTSHIRACMGHSVCMTPVTNETCR